MNPHTRTILLMVGLLGLTGGVFWANSSSKSSSEFVPDSSKPLQVNQPTIKPTVTPTKKESPKRSRLTIPAPVECSRSVLDVQFTDSSTRTQVICLDGQLDHTNGHMVNVAMNKLDAGPDGVALEMRLRDLVDIENGNPVTKPQGVTVDVYVPNTCMHPSLEARFGGGETIVKVACEDERVDFSREMKFSMQLNGDSRMNEGFEPVIAMILKDPSEIAPI